MNMLIHNHKDLLRIVKAIQIEDKIMLKFNKIPKEFNNNKDIKLYVNQIEKYHLFIKFSS